MKITLPWPTKGLRPNAWVKWTQEEDAALRALVDEGASFAAIAEKSGRTLSAIKNRAWHLGLLTSREWTQEQLDILRREYRKGEFVDIAAICASTGKSRHAVHVKASRLGLGDFTRPTVLERKIRRPKFATKEERSASTSARIKRLFAEQGHPRGMSGKRHTEATKATIAESSKRMNASFSADQKTAHRIKAMKTKLANGTYAMPRTGATWKAGWREIGGVSKYYRSRWEANYARYLEWLRTLGHISEWQHEPKVFWFDGVKRGCVSYLPDFRVVESDGGESFHEVKGWMDARSKTKIRRMAKYHPNIKLIVIDGKAYEEIRKKLAAIIPGWE